jgi:hypothetical protein
MNFGVRGSKPSALAVNLPIQPFPSMKSFQNFSPELVLNSFKFCCQFHRKAVHTFEANGPERNSVVGPMAPNEMNFLMNNRFNEAIQIPKSRLCLPVMRCP